MSTIQRSEVKTLSDQAEIRSAHRADQASYGRPVKSVGRADIDSMVAELRQAVAGAHGTETFLFDDMQATEPCGTACQSTSKGKGRMGAHSGSVVRDRHSSGGRTRAGKGTRKSSGPSTNRDVTPSVMTAELPFATCAPQDDAGESKLRRLPDAGPYRGMRMPRRSSLPTSHLATSTAATSKVARNQPAIALRGMPRTANVSTQASGASTMEWREAFDAAKATFQPAIGVDIPSEQDSPFGRLSQLLAKPEVGGYLVMGALIACTFLI